MTQSGPDAIRLTLDLGQQVGTVWRVLTGMEHLPLWFGGHVFLDARPDGVFRETWRQDGRDIVTSGRITRFEPPSAIAWNWADDDWSGETQLLLTLQGTDTGTRLTLQHTGWATLHENKGDTLRKDHLAGWTMHLAKLEAYCWDLPVE
ncbi:SRPBCC domain-containing protein [Roseibium sp. RKSG952]|uniref:SRPBCC family protein n=1 Tax=Roseibium sp. RKSG952 TaxID=2529384 RepID=UPI0012BBE099|nr:SRPBCC domain-containing protein [Roseibium sp. RKSG952]